MPSLDFTVVALFRFPTISGHANELSRSRHDALSTAIRVLGRAQHQIGTRQRRQRRK